MDVVCGDNRFEIIAKAKEDILESTNINTSKDEMKVLDDILFRCWQMGWLDKYDEHPTARTTDGDSISRQAVLKLPRSVVRRGEVMEETVSINDIKSLPTARPTGKWEEIDFKSYKCMCSECHLWSPIMGNYCPNCGADMRGGGHDDDDND